MKKRKQTYSRIDMKENINLQKTAIAIRYVNKAWLRNAKHNLQFV